MSNLCVQCYVLLVLTSLLLWVFIMFKKIAIAASWNVMKLGLWLGLLKQEMCDFVIFVINWRSCMKRMFWMSNLLGASVIISTFGWWRVSRVAVGYYGPTAEERMALYNNWWNLIHDTVSIHLLRMTMNIEYHKDAYFALRNLSQS